MIEIVPYDAAWPLAFERERAELQDALGARALRIEHHGSTAVPGMAAKPVIDIQISVAVLHPLDAYAPSLAALGYTHRPHPDDAFAPFFHRPAEWPHTHHVHVVEAGSGEERRTLAFRDYLRAHPAAARDYEALKRTLALRHGGRDAREREAYAIGKSEFIARLLDAAEVAAYYEGYQEETRLAGGESQLEFERTKEILLRHLPPSPARIVDVGGAAGVYSLWLASLGYEVHLIDASERLVEEARRRSDDADRPIASASVGNAGALPADNESADAVLVMGPLYHLTSRKDRVRALEEAHRVVREDGFLAVAGISRYASALDGLARNFSLDPGFVSIRDRDLVDGQHRNDGRHPFYFTTAYFHTPEGLKEEMDSAGIAGIHVVGVEGPAWILPDFEARWADAAQRDVILDTARVLEAETSVVGVSAHLLGLGWKRM